MNLLEQIAIAGVVGAGGAGFPTHIKLNCQVEYLLINAAECEPLLNTDKYLMNTFPEEIVEAVEATAKHVSAKEVYIAVKKVNEKEINSLQAALSKWNSSARIFPLDNYYPAGDEQMIVYDITGRTVPPAGLPLDVGCVVSNVATMLNIYDAMGDRPVTHKYLTVTGEVHSPQVLRVPIGTSFAQCIHAAGGSKLHSYKVLNGGPMMGKVHEDKEIDKIFVTKTTSGIIVVPAEGNFIARTDDMTIRQMLNRAKSACIQCSFCTDLCPRQLIGHPLRPNMVMRQMATLNLDKELETNDILEEALICCECGVCETFACPMGLSPRQVNMFVKAKLNTRYNRKEQNYTASALRQYRKIVPSKIMARMGLSKLYDSKTDSFSELTVGQVNIPVRQHIGAPAAPVVKEGDQVTAGQLIAQAAQGPPSSNIHASIPGTVVSVDDIIQIRGGE